MYLFDVAQQTSTAKVVAFSHKFYKTRPALRIHENETKVASTKVFIDNFFASESEIESKYNVTKRASFETFCGFLT